MYVFAAMVKTFQRLLHVLAARGKRLSQVSKIGYLPASTYRFENILIMCCFVRSHFCLNYFGLILFLASEYSMVRKRSPAQLAMRRARAERLGYIPLKWPRIRPSDEEHEDPKGITEEQEEEPVVEEMCEEQEEVHARVARRRWCHYKGGFPPPRFYQLAGAASKLEKRRLRQKQENPTYQRQLPGSRFVVDTKKAMLDP